MIQEHFTIIIYKCLVQVHVMRSKIITDKMNMHNSIFGNKQIELENKLAIYA